MKDIYCYKFKNDVIELVGIIDTYESFTFERNYSGIGEWKLVVSGYSKNSDAIKESNIIWVNRGVCGIITKNSIERNESANTYTVSGLELKGLAQKRIVIPANNETHQHYSKTAPELIIKGLIEQQIINATNSKRRIAGKVVIDNDEVSDVGITYDGRFSNVAEDISNIAETYQIGWYADIENGSIVWHIFHGVDRRASQTVNDRLIISYDYDTLAGGSLEQSFHSTNTALVAGQGEGTDRSTTIVNDSNEGFDRTEIYVDARDLEDDKLLPQRGAEKIAEYGNDVIFDVVPAIGFFTDNYRVSYDLGDVGTMKDINTDFRLTSIVEVYENNSFNLNFTFGYDGATLSQALKRLTGNANTASMVEASDTSEKDAYAIIDKIYPVGSIYMSVNNTNPSLLFAGTAWEPWGAGRVPVGVDANDSDFASAGLEGGEKTHTLTVEEMPNHNHEGVYKFRYSNETEWSRILMRDRATANSNGYNFISPDTPDTQNSEISSPYTGGNGAHNNLQPYITCYMWKRVATAELTDKSGNTLLEANGKTLTVKGE